MDRDRNATNGLVIGLALGVPASYFLQSGIIRAKVSLGAYRSSPKLGGRSPRPEADAEATCSRRDAAMLVS